jgi:hypothetical protein
VEFRRTVGRTRLVALICTLAGAAGALLVTGLASTIAQSGSGTDLTPVQDDAEAGSLLFVQNANGGSLTRGGKTNKLHLVLRDVDPNGLYFSDRPRRIAGVLTVPELLNSLGFGKKNEPAPNAVLQVETAAGTDALPLELMRPRYERAQNRLSFTIHRLTAGLTTSRTPFRAKLDRFGNKLDGAIPPNFGRASLFIDDGGNDCDNDMRNNLSVPLTLIDHYHWTTDSWEVTPPTTVRPGETVDWEDEGGFSRGCYSRVTYQAPDGQTFQFITSDPYKGSNTATCTASAGPAFCSHGQPQYSGGGSISSGFRGVDAICAPGGPCDQPPPRDDGHHIG